MKNKNNVYVKVESKEQAENYRKVLEAMGEPISDIFWVCYSEIEKSHTNLCFCLKGNWTMGATGNGAKITFGELIDLLQRKPLLISEDGVELFEGDSYYRAEIYHSKWVLSNYTKDCLIDGLKLDHCVVHNPKIAKAFITKKAAIEWIESQKPKAYEVKLFNGGTANLYKNEIILHGGIKLTPSDLEDLSHSFRLYFGKDLKNG